MADVEEKQADEVQEELKRVMPVLPFERRPECPKCGNRDRFSLRALWFGSSGTGFDWSYCRGSQAEKHRHTIIPGLIEPEHRTPCFGVFEEHLHVRCRGCGFHQLMEPKGAAHAQG